MPHLIKAPIFFYLSTTFYFTGINAVVYIPFSKAVVLLVIQVTFKINKTYLQVPYQTGPSLKALNTGVGMEESSKQMSFKSISLFSI